MKFLPTDLWLYKYRILQFILLVSNNTSISIDEYVFVFYYQSKSADFLTLFTSAFDITLHTYPWTYLHIRTGYIHTHM